MKVFLIVTVFFLFICSSKSSNFLKAKIIDSYEPCSHISVFVEKESAIQSQNSKNDNMIKFLKDLVILYFQIFIVFTIISLYKCYEESIILKDLHVKNKYSIYLDLSKINLQINTNEYEGKNVYVSGLTEILSSAKDEDLDQFMENLGKQYVKIERKVEIYHISEKKWKKLGKIGSKDETFSGDLNLDCEIATVGDNYMQVSYLGDIFTFPRLISSMFLGRVNYI